MATIPLEYAASYVSECGNKLWVAVGDDKAVRWCVTVGWIEETAEALGDAKAHWDIPAAVLRSTWQTTPGVYEDLTKSFIQPHLGRDLSKRQYRTSRSWSVPTEENEDESWLVFRLHKLAIRINHE